MAKIGLKNLRYSKLDETDKVTTPASFGKAVDCKVSIEKNSANLHADDAVAESDYSFKSGTVALTVDEDADTVFADVLGHTIGEDGEMVRNANDVAPYVALGRIITKQVNGVRRYKVEFLHKVKFIEPNTDEKTKGESVEFGTNAIEGTVHALENGDWSKTKTFELYSDASAYLDGLLTASAS
jgi:phi13 family phage major tail protein